MICLSTRGRFLPAAVSAACVALSSAVMSSADVGNAASELDGTWKLVSVEQDGEVMERDDDVRWIVKGGQVFFGGEMVAAIVEYGASNPKGLNLSFRSPKNDYEGIHALEKDELKICLNTNTTGAKDRPADFATRGKTNLRVLRFQRAGPDAAGPGTVR